MVYTLHSHVYCCKWPAELLSLAQTCMVIVFPSLRLLVQVLELPVTGESFMRYFRKIMYPAFHSYFVRRLKKSRLQQSTQIGVYSNSFWGLHEMNIVLCKCFFVFNQQALGRKLHHRSARSKTVPLTADGDLPKRLRLLLGDATELMRSCC